MKPGGIEMKCLALIERLLCSCRLSRTPSNRKQRNRGSDVTEARRRIVSHALLL